MPPLRIGAEADPSCPIPREITPEDEAVLLQAPLRAIPADVLGRYMVAATAFGRPNHAWWPAFVPRLVELAAAGDWPSTVGAEETFVLLHGPHDLGKPLWRADFSRDEVASLDDFQHAFWRDAACGTLEAFGRAGAHMDMIALMFLGADFRAEPMIAAVGAETGPGADLTAAVLVDGLTDETGGLDRWLFPERGRRPCLDAARPALEAWLRQPDLGRRLVAARATAIDGWERERLDGAIERLILTGAVTDL